MPFKSESQRRFFHAAEQRGDLPKGTAAKWEEHTKNKQLPEKVMEKSAFEIGFEKKAFAPLMAMGRLGKSVSGFMAAKAPNAPKFFQKPMQAVTNFGKGNTVGLGAATLGAGALGVGGLALGAKKMLTPAQPVQQQQPKYANFQHAAELAGLGILAAPAASHLAGHEWKSQKAKNVAEVGGLGVLAAPSIAHFVSKSKKLAPYVKHLV